MLVTIQEVKKEGKAIQREQSLSFEHAERVLRKSKSWQLPEGSAFSFKDGALHSKPVNGALPEKPVKESKHKKTEN